MKEVLVSGALSAVLVSGIAALIALGKAYPSEVISGIMWCALTCVIWVIRNER